MSHGSFSFRSKLWRALVLAGLAGLLPLNTALAQSYPRVRVERDEAAITLTKRATGRVITVVTAGTVLDVIHMDGDPYVHMDTNQYLVALPRDAWGRRHLGWISGRDVQGFPQVEPAAPRSVQAQSTPSAAQAPRPPQEVDAPPAPAVDIASAARAPEAVTPPEVSEVVLHFAFAKSDLTAEAVSTLSCAMEQLTTDGQDVSFALEGHADWSGPEAFNERLGLERAEAVKRYLTEEHRIPADAISVVSFGERRPAASNDTREGRAENRRVVVKVGGSWLLYN
jgi:outer membrane protein OmpA-like peptidoglycan-associated protein